VGPSPKSARGPKWRRSSRGLYVPASVEQTVEQRILEASAVLPDHGGVTGWAALKWMGGRWFDGLGAGQLERPVTLVTAGDDIRAQPGIAVSAERLDPRLLTFVDGVRMTTPVRSADFEMRYADGMRAAVQVLDMAAYSDLVSIAEAWAYAMTHPGWTGIGMARAAIALADENSWSPQETLMRLIWILDAELPPPLCNRPLFDRDGHHIGTPDMIDEEAGVVGEYDSPLHLAGKRRARDLRREERFRRHGLEYFTMVAADHATPGVVVARMHSTRERAAFQAPSSRAWTLVPPTWWQSTHTVEQRRALSPGRRSKLLAYRAA
jgi:hypothetical protein